MSNKWKCGNQLELQTRLQAVKLSGYQFPGKLNLRTS